MKNLKSIVALFFLVVIFSFTNKNHVSEGLLVGDKIPDFKIDNFDTDKVNEKYVLVNFWAGYDAVSRINNLRFDKTLKTIGNGHVAYVSVSFDTSRDLFEEMVKQDGVDKSKQYHDKAGTLSKLYDKFRLKKGFSNYLVNHDGVIIAKNLSPEKLTKMISQ